MRQRLLKTECLEQRQLLTSLFGGICHSGIRLLEEGEQLGGNDGGTDVDLADLDGDGDLDIFRTASIPGIWENDGSGHFVELPSQIERKSENIYSALGDIDGDGDIDAVTAAFGRNVVYRNNGAMRFAAEEFAFDSVDETSIDVDLADLDGDGDLDAFVANTSSMPNRVYLNDGGGNFSDSSQRLGHADSKSVELGDMDNDGDIDAVVGNTSEGGAALWLNDGRGMFSFSELSSRSRSKGEHAAIVDFNGDGLADVAVAGAFSNSLYLNQGDANFIIRSSFGSGSDVGGTASHIVFGDLDNDGDQDAISANWTDVPSKVFVNRTTQGDDFFRISPVAIHFDRGLAHEHFALGDVNGDGTLDLVSSIWGGKIELHVNEPKPRLPEPVSLDRMLSDFFGEELTITDVQPIGDFNADGFDDIIAISKSERRSATIHLLRGCEHGIETSSTFTLPEPFPIPPDLIDNPPRWALIEASVSAGYGYVNEAEALAARAESEESAPILGSTKNGPISRFNIDAVFASEEGTQFFNRSFTRRAGSWETHNDANPRTGDPRNRFDGADFNGDGRQDIISYSSDDGYWLTFAAPISEEGRTIVGHVANDGSIVLGGNGQEVVAITLASQANLLTSNLDPGPFEQILTTNGDVLLGNLEKPLLLDVDTTLPLTYAGTNPEEDLTASWGDSVGNVGSIDITFQCGNGNGTGDVDGDGGVNFIDFLRLADNFGKTSDAVYAEGDLDCNGRIDFLDFLTLATNFGS